MTKQHVGAQSDAIVADPALEAARAAQRAALAAIRPRSRGLARPYNLGDGDLCPIPVNESCGKMFVIGQSQYCPNAGHYPAPALKATPGRTIWPYHHLQAAVAAYHSSTAGEAATKTVLPDLDIDLGGL